jgi:hypothetical protein
LEGSQPINVQITTNLHIEVGCLHMNSLIEGVYSL